MKRRGFFAVVFGALSAPFLLRAARYQEGLSAVETVRRSFGLPPTALPLTGGTGLMWHKDAFEAVQLPASKLFVVSGGKGYIYSSKDAACSIEDFADLCRPHYLEAQRRLAEAIDRG